MRETLGTVSGVLCAGKLRGLSLVCWVLCQGLGKCGTLTPLSCLLPWVPGLELWSMCLALQALAAWESSAWVGHGVSQDISRVRLALGNPGQNSQVDLWPVRFLESGFLSLQMAASALVPVCGGVCVWGGLTVVPLGTWDALSLHECRQALLPPLPSTTLSSHTCSCCSRSQLRYPRNKKRNKTQNPPKGLAATIKPKQNFLRGNETAQGRGWAACVRQRWVGFERLWCLWARTPQL